MQIADPTHCWTTVILVGSSLLGSLLSLPAQTPAAPSATIVKENPPPSASSSQPRPASPRTVPAADSAAAKDRQAGETVIHFAKDGSLKVDNKVLTEAQLGRRLKEIFAHNPKQAIILRADEETVYKNMFRVLDLCYQAGLYHVSFASRSPTPPAAP